MTLNLLKFPSPATGCFHCSPGRGNTHECCNACLLEFLSAENERLNFSALEKDEALEAIVMLLESGTIEDIKSARALALKNLQIIEKDK